VASVDSLPKKLTVPADVLSQELDDETVILDLRSERYMSLDSVGSRFWQLLQNGGDAEMACGVLLQEYDVEEAVLRRDLAELIAKMCDVGIVSVD
jgi:hypothetical protein